MSIKGKESGRITIPCGKCFACLSNKRQSWLFRLEKELKEAKTAFFVTITYDDENKPCEGVKKSDVQKFIKLLRHEKECIKEFKYFLVSEYGSQTLRPHYHAIFYNLDTDFEHCADLLSRIWKKGFVSVGTVTSASINYVAKYCITKKSNPDGQNECFALISKRPAIGSEYLKKAGQYHKSGQIFYGVLNNGSKIPIPRYYKEKLFTKEQIEVYNEEIKKQDSRKEFEKIQGLSIEKQRQQIIDDFNNINANIDLIKKRLDKNEKI